MTEYFSLTKPRMTFANVIVAAAAFVFGSPLEFSWAGFLLMCAGLWLVIGSGCAFNNWYDRDIDARMERTKERSLPARRVSTLSALAISFTWLIAGAALLWLTNIYCFGAALLGWAAYALYTPIKHKHPVALFVGAVAGAMPPVVGYAAAAGRLDAQALWLFVFLFIWQIPHFIAISIYRYEEYAAAGVPLFIRATPTEKAHRIARAVFYISLVVLVALCAVLILHRWVR